MEEKSLTEFDVVIIGAGPAGAAAASYLINFGFTVAILEKSLFPRFMIGESLLPQSMVYLDKCGLLDAIPTDEFQIKKGALFKRGPLHAKVDFSKKITPGPSETWQVTRSSFDHLLIQSVQKRGVSVFYECLVDHVNFDKKVTIDTTIKGQARQFSSKFLIDSSGNAMVLPRLMQTFSQPQAGKVAYFAHFKNDTRNQEESEHILISVHPTNPSIWYWGIPLKGNKISVGIVSDPLNYKAYPTNPDELFKQLISEEPALAERLKNSTQATPTGFINNYSSKVSQTYGEQFLIIGNAGGFIDPVFSSGVTIALKSAYEGASRVAKLLQGEGVDWLEYEKLMAVGYKTFESFVNAWYDGTLQDIIFLENKEQNVESRVNSILAGYAWDEANPFVKEPVRKLKVLGQLCQRLAASS